MSLLWIFGIICLFSTTGLFSQTLSRDILSTKGSSDHSGTVRVDWVIGEPVITPAGVGNISLGQGFLQPVHKFLSIQAFSNAPITIGSQLNLTAIPSENIGSFFWQGPNGFTANTLTPVIPNATQSASGIYTVTQNYYQYSASDTILIAVYPPLSNNSITSAQTILVGNTPQMLSGSQPAGGSGSYQYQWQSSVNGFSWTALPGETNQDYTPGSLVNTSYFRRVVTDVQLQSASFSSPLAITVVIYSVSIQSNAPLFAGATLNLSAVPSHSPGTFVWAGPNGFTSNLQAPVIPNIQTGYAGVYTVTQTINSTQISATQSVSIYPVLSSNTIGSAQTLQIGNSANTLTGSPITGGSGSYTY
ncbi:MAG: hypothetical protein EBS07_10845, partial [Sphingobacteriia bacterium]|nr:hypothetical protein [Sphingobacteriia bacterium]